MSAERENTPGAMAMTAAIDQAIAWVREHQDDLRRIAADGIRTAPEEAIAEQACGILSCVATSAPMEVRVVEMGT